MSSGRSSDRAGVEQGAGTLFDEVEAGGTEGGLGEEGGGEADGEGAGGEPGGGVGVVDAVGGDELERRQRREAGAEVVGAAGGGREELEGASSGAVGAEHLG